MHEVSVYPDDFTASLQRQKYKPSDQIPPRVLAIYNETINALNSNAPMLAGAGLRAIVEAVCRDQGLVDGSLQDKIDKLVEKELLAKPQANALHEERFLGNSAIHDIETPDWKALADGQQIVETLLHTIYILPLHVKSMRNNREARDASKIRTYKEDIES